VETNEFIIGLFCRIDDQLREVKKHPQAKLWPSELATLAALFALKGVQGRAFYRWVRGSLSHLFPRLPERTRLFRAMAAHEAWAERFLASPGALGALGVADSYGIELLHPVREWKKRRWGQPKKPRIAKKGRSNRRWIAGVKLGLVLDRFGLVVAWSAADASAHDGRAFQQMIGSLDKRLAVLADSQFHCTHGDPPNLKLCGHGEWNGRMLVETVFSMLTQVCHLKHLYHRSWPHLRAHLGWLLAAWNVVMRWIGMRLDPKTGFVHLHLAQFGL